MEFGGRSHNFSPWEAPASASWTPESLSERSLRREETRFLNTECRPGRVKIVLIFGTRGLSKETLAC